MLETIKNFPKQFAYRPEIKNADKLKPAGSYIVLGLGGSHLAADLLAEYQPEKDIIVYSDYGLNLPEKVLQNSLIIASSYSGNTEEVIDGFQIALEKKLNVAAVTVGGKLLELAQKNNLPYIQLPDMNIQPRSALGLSLKAILKLLGDEKTYAQTETLAESLKPEELRAAGQELARKLKSHVPIIYSSRRKYSLAYNWKIKFNETAKIPAFANALPELNHNEMTGFDAISSTKSLSEKFYFIFLKDSKYDHPKVVKRMEILEKLYRARGHRVEVLELSGLNHFHKIFSSLTLADWTAFYLAQDYGVDPEEVPMVEEFKKLIA